MNGITRIVQGGIAQGKLKGKAFADALYRDLNKEEDAGNKKQHDKHK